MTVAGEEPVEAPPALPSRSSLPLGPVPRAGVRAFLELDRKDIVWMVALFAIAFVLRAASPIFPDLLSSSATHAGVSAWGMGYPNKNTDECMDVPVGPHYSARHVCGFVFDEVYFPVDASKDLAGRDYFDPEPPLSKLLMAPPIAIWGFKSWTWRTTTAIAGSLLVVLVYLIARRLRRRDRFFAVAAATFVAFDGLAFVESRTGVIDVIAIMFAALLWYAFLLHWQARTRRQWTATLYFMALCAGLAFGAKLTALAPLAVAAVLIAGRFLEPLALRVVPPLRRLAGPRRGEAIMWRDAAGGEVALMHYVLAVLVGLTIFAATFSRYLSYDHPTVYHFDGCTTEQGLHLAYTEKLVVPVSKVGRFTRFPDPVKAVTNIVHFMGAGLEYHRAECHPHPYASDWYTWPVMYHPVLFYADYKTYKTPAGADLRGWITDMGNPAVWWLAIPALLYCLWKALGGRGAVELTVAAAGVMGMGAVAVWSYEYHHHGVRWLGVAVLVGALVYAFRRRPWAIAVAALGLVSLAEMIWLYHDGLHYGGSRVDPGRPFQAAFAAMVAFGAALVVNAVVTRRFLTSFALLGYLAAWLMWVQGNERRVLFFYHMLGALPFMAIALAYTLTRLRRVEFTVRRRHITLAPVSYAVVALVIAGFAFFYPMWTALPQTGTDWQTRIWLGGWE